MPYDEDDDYEPYDGDDDYGLKAGNVLGPNGPRVCATRCDTCIFHPGNRMQLRPGRVRQMVQDSLNGGGFITCHATLPGVQEVDAPAVCRGFFDAYGHLSNVLRVWSRLGRFDEIAPPKLHRTEEPRP